MIKKKKKKKKPPVTDEGGYEWIPSTNCFSQK